MLPWYLALLALSSWQEEAMARLPRTWTQTAQGQTWHVRVDPNRSAHGHTLGWVDPAQGTIVLAMAQDLPRALVWTIAQYQDALHHYNDAPSWRRFNRWERSLLDPRLHPRNEHAGGYALPAGKESPALDWLSAVTAFVIPGPDAGEGASSACRLLSQRRHVRELFDSLGTHFPAPPCTAFHAWADIEHLRGIDVGFASPTNASVGSMFGHLFLRMRYVSSEQGRIVAFVADTVGALEDESMYVLKGLFGGFSTHLVQDVWLEALRAYDVVEGRDVLFWTVNFDDAIRDRFLERIWDLLHTARDTYYFTHQNCASLLVDVFNDVLPPSLQVNDESFIKTPGWALDVLTRAHSPHGGPLLSRVERGAESIEHRARLAETQRHAMKKVLQKDQRLAWPIRKSESADGRERAAAYASLAHAPATKELGAYLQASAHVELGRATRANVRAERQAARQNRRDARALSRTLWNDLPRVVRQVGSQAWGDSMQAVVTALQDPHQETRYEAYLALQDFLVAWERAKPQGGILWRYVAADARLLGWASANHWYDPTERDLPAMHDAVFRQDSTSQPYQIGFQHLYNPTFVTRLGAPVWAAQAAADAVTTELKEDIPSVEARVDRYDAAWPHSGLHAMEIGSGAVLAHGSLMGAILGGALYDDQLGDNRRHGFAGDTALTLLKGTMWLGASGGTPRAIRSDTTLITYRTLRLPPWGWDFSADVERSCARNTRASFVTSVGALLRFVSGARGHMLLRAGLAGLGWQGFDGKAIEWGAGVPVAVEARYDAPIPFQPWVWLRCQTTPAFQAAWQLQGRADALAGAHLCADCQVLGMEHVGLSLVSRVAFERDLGGNEVWGSVGLLLE